jgi:hypothetical protein
MNSAALHHDKLTWIAIARLGLIPVSYTHLTLPTKLL